MEDFIFSLNAILPIFLTMAVGFFLKQIGFLKQDFLDQLNKFIFYVATSALLFSDTSKVDFRETFDARFVSFMLLAIAGLALILWITVPLFEKNRIRAGALIHCGYRSNFAILGLPLAKNLLDAVGVAKTEIILAFGVPLFNVIAVLCLSYWSGTKGDYMDTIKKIATNPLIIGALSGLLLSIFGIKLPTPIATSVGYLGNMAMGLGLIVLGASFDVKKFICNFKETILGTSIKLLISPMLIMTAALLLGFRGDEAVIAFILSGAPTAVNSFVMAKAMGSDSELTSGIVICSTGLCTITMFIGIYLLRIFEIF